MPTDDPQGFTEQLRRQRRRLSESAAVADRDREALERWLRRKDGSVAVSTLSSYLMRVRRGSEISATPLVELDEPGWHDLVFRLRHEEDLADSTVQNYENAILLFLDDVLKADWPGEVDRTTVDDNDAGPDVDDILTPADIQALTETARHQRDVALIEFFADTGARLSLALSLRVGDLDLTDPPTYTPNGDALGLKGADIQPYPLIDSAAALRSYLRTSHPRPDEDDVALFHKLKPHGRPDNGARWSDDGGLVAHAAREQLQRIGGRADADKPVNPHNFRHTAITRMVREGYSRSQIEHRVHWELDTDMWATYEHITSEEHNADIFAEAGVLETEATPDRVRKNCGTCGEPLAPHHEWCPNCGQPASPGAADCAENASDTVLDALVDATNPALRRELRGLLEELEDRPETARTRDHDEDTPGSESAADR